jgi:hypothetical protein
MNEASFWGRVAEPARRSIPDQVRDALRETATRCDDECVAYALQELAQEIGDDAALVLRGLLR